MSKTPIINDRHHFILKFRKLEVIYHRLGPITPYMYVPSLIGSHKSHDRISTTARASLQTSLSFRSRMLNRILVRVPLSSRQTIRNPIRPAPSLPRSGRGRTKKSQRVSGRFRQRPGEFLEMERKNEALIA